MGRNAKKGDKSKPAAAGKSKKAKNVFKVNNANNKKKPKEVQGKLKKIKDVIKNKQEKVHVSLKDHHKDMVFKPVAAKAAPAKKAKKPVANAKAVSNKLGDLKV